MSKQTIGILVMVACASNAFAQTQQELQGFQNQFNQNSQSAYIDQGAARQVIQNEQQIRAQGTSGLVVTDGAQFVQQGQQQAQQSRSGQPVYGTATSAPAPKGSAGSAKGAGIQQLITVGASVATAGALASPCGTPTSAAWACPMMALSLAQAAMSLGASGKSKESANQFSTGTGQQGWGTGGTETGYNDPNASLDTNTRSGDGSSGGGPGGNGSGNNAASLAVNSQTAGLISEMNRMNSALEKAGYKVSPDGSSVTMPNGKSVPSSAFNSPEAMKSAGFSDAEIEAMMNAKAGLAGKVNDKIKAIAMAVEGGGGSGMNAPSGGGSAGGAGGRGYNGFNFRMPAERKERSKVSGLSKQLGDDKIGLASDDIFEMVHIRYLERDKAGHFEK